MMDESLFAKNLAAWEIVNPHWAALLKTVQCSFIFFSENPDGSRNLSVETNGKKEFFYPHEHILEAEKEWLKKVNLDLSQVIFIYGIGLGYHYEVLKEWLHQDSRRRIVVFEDNLEVVHRFLETELATLFLHDKQARLQIVSWPFNENDPAIRENAAAYCFDSYDIVASSVYSRFRADRFVQLKELMTFWHLNYVKSSHEIFGSNHGFFPKYLKNIFSLPTAYWGSFLKDKFIGVPAIICGAGPSLGKNIDVLKTLQDRALIFGPGTSMNALNSFGLIPHLGVSIDPNNAQFDRILANDAFEVPYFYRNRINPEALNLIQGDRVAVSGAGLYTFPEWVEKELGLETLEVDEGNNVINFSLSIAKMLGCNPIILVGVDLAYTENQSYAANLKRHALSHSENAFITKSQDEELIIHDDIYGKPVYTLWKWRAEANWIGWFASQNPQKLINATEGGIGFPGVPNLDLAKVADQFMQRTYDLTSMIHGEIQNSTLPSDVTGNRIEEVMLKFKRSLERCNRSYYETDTAIILEEELAYTYLLKDVQDMFNFVLGMKAQLSQSLEEAQEKKEQLKEDLEKESKRFMDRYTKELLKAFHFPEISPAEAPADLKIRPNLETHFEGNFGLEEDAFYPNGSLKELHFHRDGKLNGPSLFFSDQGSLLSIAFYEEGLKEGVSHLYYASGNLKASMPFKKGVPDGAHDYFYDSGSPKSILPYKDGLLDGVVLLFYSNKAKKREIGFKKGLRDGFERLWNEKGQLLIEAQYANGYPIGKASSRHPDGTLKMQIEYDETGKELKVEQWHANGEKKTPKELDYFDLLITSTQNLAKAIDLCTARIENVLQNLKRIDFSLLEKFQELKLDLIRLKEANQKIQTTFSQESFKEPIWKSAAFQKQVQHQISSVIEQMLIEVQKIYHAIEEAHKKLGENGLL